MSGMDRMQINTRERPSSTDINDLQSMIHRSILDAMRYMHSAASYPVVSGVPSTTIRNVVLGGLDVTPNGSDVDVRAGVLLQDSGSLTPAPGPLDSDYRIGIARSAVTVPMPSPGSESWVVIEAQMTETVTLNESRDILDAGTGNFVPTLVDKRAERRIQYQTLTGVGTVPDFTGGDWVPIAVVRRPGGGGAVAVTDIYDIRPLWAERLAHGNVSEGSSFATDRTQKQNWSIAINSESLVVTGIEGKAANGLRLWVAGTFDVSTSGNVVEDAFGGFSASTWYYLYLVAFRGQAVRHAEATQRGNALLVLSATAPGLDMIGSGGLTPQAPWDTNTSPNGPVCVGALLRNSANTGFEEIAMVNGKATIRTGNTALLVANITGPSAGANAITPGASVPDARAATFDIDWIGAGSGTLQARLTPTGSTLGYPPGGNSGYVDDGATQTKPPITIPIAAQGTKNFDLYVLGGSPNGSTVAQVRLTGYEV